MKKFLILMFIFFVVLGCDQGQQMMKPILTPEPIADTIIEQPEPITTEITYYIDGIPHTLTAHLTAHAALASERYADMIIYFKEYNDENCGKQNKTPFNWDLADNFRFYFTSTDEAMAFNKIAESHREVKQYPPENAPILDENPRGAWGVMLLPACLR